MANEHRSLQMVNGVRNSFTHHNNIYNCKDNWSRFLLRTRRRIRKDFAIFPLEREIFYNIPVCAQGLT